MSERILYRLCRSCLAAFITICLVLSGIVDAQGADLVLQMPKAPIWFILGEVHSVPFGSLIRGTGRASQASLIP